MMLEKMLIGYDKRLRPDFGGIKLLIYIALMQTAAVQLN